MPTYRLLPKEGSRRRRSAAPSPVLCEECGRVLGHAYDSVTRLRMPAADAIALWPELRLPIKHHESDCHGPASENGKRNRTALPNGLAGDATAGCEPTSAERFAVNLRELRQAAGLSRAELAQRAKTSAHAIIFLESGARGPNWDTLLALCDALGVSPTAFNRERPTEEPVPRARKKRRA